MNSLKIKINLSVMLIVCMTIALSAQDVSVIYISGDAYTEETNGEKKTYKKIVFGPLPDSENITLKDNTSLKLLNSKNEICELDKAGTYKRSDITFSTTTKTGVEKGSMFTKFCDYFHSFFVNHSSSESKVNYKNSIHAISRGASSPAQLDFPQEGLLPVDAGPLSFSWSHACNDCQYVVSINSLSTKANVFAWTTNEQKVLLEKPEEFLKKGEQYYWSVNVSGMEIETENYIFTAAPSGDYSKNVEASQIEIAQSAFDLPELSTIYVMTDLAEKDLLNYSLIYGFKQSAVNADNAQLKNFVERFWYDRLIE